MEFSYHFLDEQKICSPGLIYYKDIICSNIEKTISIAGTPDRLWPHVKSHKMKSMVEFQISKGITHFKCATIAEAEMTASAGAKALILAYPLVGPNIERFMNLMKAYPHVTMYSIADSTEAVTSLSEIFKSYGMCCNVLMDIDNGQKRTGVDIEKAERLYYEWYSLKGINLTGLHCYDGNRHEKDYCEREYQVRKTDEQIIALKNRLIKREYECGLVVLGGTPSFPIHAKYTEESLSPGTCIIQDAGYESSFPDMKFIPGAAILTRVISLPGSSRFTLDCGYKAISAETAEIGVLSDNIAAKSVFQNEEHWVFEMDKGHEAERPKIGDIFYIIPWHICPTSALYQEAIVVSGGKNVDIWEVSARNRRLTF